MNKKLSLSTFVWLLFSIARVSAGKESDLNKLIKNSKIPGPDLGMVIATKIEGKHKIILEHNLSKKFIPASISKIVTTAAVLDRLPAGNKFKTQLLVNADQIKEGKLNGDLFFKGGGDPSFVSENLWYLVNVLKRSKIREINGDIVVDDSLFDKTRFDESRQDTRVDRAYDAPVGALSFNWNSVNIFVRPDPNASKPNIFIDPSVDLFEVENKASQVSGSTSDLFVERKNNRIIVSGKIGKSAKEFVAYKNIEEPAMWAGANLKLFLQQEGIKITGNIKSGKTNENLTVLAEYESKPIELIITDMNKFSNNFVAEMLTKNLSLQIAQEGNLKDGMKVISSFLSKHGISNEDISLINPSGLTRENKMTPKGLLSLLQIINDDFRMFPEFLISLPIAGIDGTLKKRMKGESAERWVRAKTGFLTNVVSLAGYAGRANGQVYQFVFMFNGTTDEARVRNFFDQVLNSLLE